MMRILQESRGGSRWGSVAVLGSTCTLISLKKLGKGKTEPDPYRMNVTVRASSCPQRWLLMPVELSKEVPEVSVEG